MNDNTLQRSFFLTLLLVVTIAFVWLIRVFLQPIFWAVALAIVLYPLQRLLLHKFHGRASLASLATVLCLVIVVIMPLIGLTAAVTTEGAALYKRLDTQGIGFDELYRQAEQRVPRLVGALKEIGVDPDRVESQLSSAAVAASRFIASRALSIGQDTVQATVLFFMMLYLLFFFLRDGTGILDGVVNALPLGDHRERLLFNRFAQVSRATIKGTFVVGIVQGTLGGIAFAVLGLAAPVLWGTVMALVSIVPAVGPALVWLPAAIYLFATGQPIAGGVLIAIGIFVIGLVDNLLRPVLVGRDTRMPDYLILLSTLGGLAAFGLAGIVIGPIIAAFFLSVWQMAHEEFRHVEADAQPTGHAPAHSAPSKAGEPPC